MQHILTTETHLKKVTLVLSKNKLIKNKIFQPIATKK